MKIPTISVIIPIYNTEATLARSIDSVLCQSYTDFEIVLVDDGSPDGAGKIADDYAARHDCITVVHKRNAGLAEARRTGVEHATGQWVVHLDSDDELTSDALEFLLGKATKHDLDIAYGCFLRVNEQGNAYLIKHRTEGVLSGDDFLRLQLEVGNLNSSCAAIFKRELWLNDVFPPADRALPSEDVLINVKMSRYVKRVGQWNHPVYRYYYNAASLSITGRLSSIDSWKRYYELVERDLSDRGILEQYQTALHEQKIDRLAFYIYPLVASDPWVKRVLAYPAAGYGKKTRLLRALLHYPHLCHTLIMANKRVKRLLGRAR